jgi:uncharacterized membrane protein
MVLAIMLAGVMPCAADLTFCNRSDATMHLALGVLKRDDGWTSQGWWSLAAGECRTLVHGLPARVYYAFAIDERGRSWSAAPDQRGGWFCISPDSFALRNQDYEDDGRTVRCESGDLKAKQFLIVNTGNSTHYTHTFTVREPAGEARPPVAPGAQSGPPPVNAAPHAVGAGTACQRFPNLC